MMQRRALIIGGLAVAAAGVAEALRPRRKLILLKGGKIDGLVPRNFPGWNAEATSGLVSPDQAGKLAKSLYSEIVERVYHEQQTGDAVMLLAAYGDTQSDLLQLHRPETCYPAVGYALASSRPVQVALRNGAKIPAREVVAVADDRRENILYWTRIGEHLPQSAGQQRSARFQNSLDGYVADGILFRCSAVGESEACFSLLNRFVPALLDAAPAQVRPALVGTQIARQMA
jgi:EpsI family protein